MFDFMINLKTAKTVAVSSSLLAAADAVIESDPFFARHESAWPLADR
ncbi:MAG: hypothetical protein WAK90_22620 [Pseudolabrys sp.]